MKKLLAILFSSVMVFSFAACGNKADTETTKEKTTASTTKEKTTVSTTKESTTAAKPESVVDVKTPAAGVVKFAAFTFKVNNKAITNDTLKNYQIYKITCKSSTSKGTTTEDTYGGYLLTDVLKAAGVTDYKSVTVAASDGHEGNFVKADINQYTLVAIEKNKAVGDKGTVWVAPCDQSSAQNYCKLVVSITTK